MKIRLSQLRKIIREAVVQAKKDLNKDGENDFEDVMIARMKASGMDHEDAVEKGEDAAKSAKKKQNEALTPSPTGGKKSECNFCHGLGVDPDHHIECSKCDGTGVTPKL